MKPQKTATKQQRKPVNFRYVAIGDNIIVSKRHWNRMTKWLRGAGIEVRETKENP